MVKCTVANIGINQKQIFMQETEQVINQVFLNLPYLQIGNVVKGMHAREIVF